MSPSHGATSSASAGQTPVSIIRDALPSVQFSSSRIGLHQFSRSHQSEDEDNEDEETTSEALLQDTPHHSRKSRRPRLPPIPDLRFEQSYLKQIEAAKGSVMWIIIITIRDQVIFPGVQGFIWALAMAGIRTLRANQAENGRMLGTWIRDWFGRLGRADTTMTMGGRSRR
jgi:hypothetical protein